MAESNANNEPNADDICHYKVLGLSRAATLEEIKMAHRLLARRLHPDKQQQKKSSIISATSANSNTSIMTTTTTTTSDHHFRRVQAAWECLRDPQKKQQYDEDLRRKEDVFKSRSKGATRIFISQMEECTDEDDGTSKGYAHECRCGDFVEIWEDDLVDNEKEILLECPGCCLAFCVINDS